MVKNKKIKIHKKRMIGFYKSIVDQDRSSIVICNLKHEIIYMNPAAVSSYAKRGGDKLIGRSVLDCHNPESRDKIQQVVEWFAADERGLDSIIKEGFKTGNKIYIGCSAGAAIAGVSVEEIKDFDKNNVGMTDFSGLGLFDGIIIPHYTKKELKRYISNSYGIEDKYKSILSVSNEKSLVMEVS